MASIYIVCIYRAIPRTVQSNIYTDSVNKVFFFCKKGKQGLERSNNVVTLGIKREITLYMSLITSVKGSSPYWMSLLKRILRLTI